MNHTDGERDNEKERERNRHTQKTQAAGGAGSPYECLSAGLDAHTRRTHTHIHTSVTRREDGELVEHNRVTSGSSLGWKE